LFQGIVVNLNLRDATQFLTFWLGDRFEFPTALVLDDWGRGATAFFDIGANYGFYSFYMYSKFPELPIYSFEPNPETFGFMQEIINNNMIKNVYIFQSGLGSCSGALELHPGIDDSGQSTFLPHPEFVNRSSGKVQITPFDKFVTEENLSAPQRPQYIAKIDVEGMEYDVLTGMQRALENKWFKGLVVEMLDSNIALSGHSRQDIIDYLNSSGYKPISEQYLIKKYGRVNTANLFFTTDL
jgi:FkbM family methyltransferase